MDIIDSCITQFDKVLRLIFPVWPTKAVVDNPADKVSELQLSKVEQHQSKMMMRVNLAGEVAAQGLYRGQLLMARDTSLKQELELAAIEEFDHYVWCQQRLEQLDARPSVFNPIWYCGAFIIGLSASLISDKKSLGFVIATEEQVGEHLASHLLSLPKTDLKSRAIVAKMYEDELKHAEYAENKGGERLSLLTQEMMHCVAQVMIKMSRVI
jgi:ubiquinone biosynthesis monooxygenase Coq7